MSEAEYKKDYEGQENDELDGEPLKFWEEKQRELVTSVVDYNLGTLSDLITNKDIDLSPKYQRRFRWEPARQSKLIESFLMNVPVPPIFLSEDSYGQYSVIDGKQRLSAVHNFLRGRLVLEGMSVFGDINGLTFDGLPVRLQTILKTRVILRAIIILRQSDSDIKFEVFRRLNTGGVKLNAQEIRNSVYPGPLNELILDLSENKNFHRLLGIRNKEKSAIYQEMRDAEFVLRFFAFRDSWVSFSGGMRRNLDSFMEHNQKMPDYEIEELKTDFLSTLKAVKACFGEYAFRRYDPERGQWRQQVLASLFDAQMFACRGVDFQRAAKKQEQFIMGLKALFANNEFRRSVDAATNTPSFFKNRISMMKSMVNETLG